jgi:ankyrin repeat protein
MAVSLYAAAQRGDVVKLGDLVSRGADVNVNFLGLSPLYGAVIERQFDAAVFLLDFGADVNSANGPARRSPLHQAVLNGDVGVIKLLLSRGANVNATTTHGRTPLDYAVDPPAPLTKPANSEEIAAILRDTGA